ncbi:hypothetical protein ACS0TY_026270 [Phlomoides rotata]
MQFSYFFSVERKMNNYDDVKVELKLKLSPPRQRKVTITSTEIESRSMMLVGCPRCLMYVMLFEEDPRCPKCKSTVLLDFLHHNP